MRTARRPTPGRAVVIVSGGAAISPFTTPTAACSSGLAAGSTDTGLREALLGAGLAVYTSPANVGNRPVTNDTEANGFDGQPEQLPAELTVNSAGSIDTAGEHLAAFLRWLSAREGVAEVDLVGHSMGGLFSRAAIRELRQSGHPLRVRSLTTLGTPWAGSFVAAVINGDADMSISHGHQVTEGIIREAMATYFTSSEGAGMEVAPRFLTGADGWNQRQAGVLEHVPVTLIGGDWFQVSDGERWVFPHDGIVSASSALAEGVSPEVVQPASTHVFNDVHSIYFADMFGLPWHKGLTWNPAVMQVVLDAIEAA